MEAISRKPFQGIVNIIRFNWHFYAMAIGAVCFLHVIKFWLPAFHSTIAITGLLIMFTTFISLIASIYVYDLSSLYTLSWLNRLNMAKHTSLVNIHAGFDETSYLLAKKYPTSSLVVLDFYDPKKHTEVSIRRARKAYPPYPETISVDTASLSLQNVSVDYIFCILSAHEIRQTKEREIFFQQLTAALKREGKIIVLEHVRDLPNFLAYNIGFFHFHSRSAWRKTFTSAQLTIAKEIKITAFLTAFILQKNGTTS